MRNGGRAGAWGVAAAVLAGLAANLVVASCRPGASPAARELRSAGALPVPTHLVQGIHELGDYVGSENCAGCHPAESRSHDSTPHAGSLRVASADLDGRWFRGAAPLRDPTTGWSYQPVLQDGRPAILAARGGDRRVRSVDLVMGSGVNGRSLISLSQDGSGVLSRLSLYREGAGFRWGWSPEMGPGRRLVNPEGRELPAFGISSCAACHSTTMGMFLDPDRHELGVGCERCHGPARSHMNALRANLAGIRARRDDPAIPRLGRLDGTQISALCSPCHRTLSEPGPDGLPRDLARSQPEALEKSACFTRSEGRLSCVSCHNPHRPAEHDPAHYNRVCAGCHGAAAEGSPGRSCPVNPRDGCTGCHMERQKLEQFATATFTNHWIRRVLRAQGSREAAGARRTEREK